MPLLPHDRLLPLLVAAMAFLAALAGAGSLAAASLANHWRAAVVGTTVEVPETTAAAAASLLGPAAHRLSQAEMAAMLQPWLGEDAGRLAISLPAVFTLPANPPPGLEQALIRVAPDALVSRDSLWQDRAASLAGSLQACGALALGVVAFVAAGVVAVATGAGLSARHEAIEIIHQLGATDGQIAAGFAGRASALALAGAVAGTVAAIPVLLALARMTAPFRMPLPAAPASRLAVLATSLPAAVWAQLAALPLLAAVIGWLAAQATVRSRLRSLP